MKTGREQGGKALLGLGEDVAVAGWRAATKMVQSKLYGAEIAPTTNQGENVTRP